MININNLKFKGYVLENINKTLSDVGEKLKNKNGVFVSTVEHLLASLHSIDVNNLLIEINSSELPAMDGSSYEFTKKIKKISEKYNAEVPSLRPKEFSNDNAKINSVIKC